MKKIIIEKPGGYHRLKLKEYAMPEPGEHEGHGRAGLRGGRQ